jgi:hypothetical protein
MLNSGVRGFNQGLNSHTTSRQIKSGEKAPLRKAIPNWQTQSIKIVRTILVVLEYSASLI